MQISPEILYQEEQPSWINEILRNFVAWWLRTFMWVHKKVVTVEELENWIKEGRDILIIDSRRKDEYEESHILNSINIHSSPFHNKFPVKNNFFLFNIIILF